MAMLEKRFDLFADKLEKDTLDCGYLCHKIIPMKLLKYLNKYSLILDLGVGSGLASRLFIKKGLGVVGADFSRELLKKASKYRYKRLIKQDIRKRLKFKKETFDVAISLGVFDFFKNLDHVFTEIRRVLKKEGYFAFTIIKNQKHDFSGLTFSHTKKEILALSKKYGFNVLYCSSFLGYKRKGYYANYYGFILKK